MQTIKLTIWLGVWLLILPFFGIPGSWKETLTVLTALVLFGHALAAYRRRRAAAVPAPAPAEAEMPASSVHSSSE